MKRVYIYVLILFVLINFSVAVFSKPITYDERPIYDVVVNDIDDYLTMFEVIKYETDSLDNYYLFVGDSVGYGIPCGSNDTISYNFSSKVPDNTYNLSIPSLYSGDIYYLLGNLQTEPAHIIYVVNYMNFIDKETNDPLEAVFWLKTELVEEGFESWYVPEKVSSYTQFKDDILGKLPLYRYNNYLKYQVKNLMDFNEIQLMPWTEKPFLEDLIHQEEYSKFFSDHSIIMDDTNPQVYFINKIVNELKYEDISIVYMPLNNTLIKDYSDKEGFIDNELKIQTYFEDLDVNFINLKDKIDTSFYSDHIHLLPAGYEFVSEIIYKEIIGN
jgi:hypothetical protein